MFVTSWLTSTFFIVEFAIVSSTCTSVNCSSRPYANFGSESSKNYMRCFFNTIIEDITSLLICVKINFKIRL